MKKPLFTNLIFFAIITIIVQILIPVINIDGLILIPDILIIFLVYVGYYYGRFESVIIGFVFGFIQDLVTQFELIGIMAFIKSIIGYFLGTMALYHSVWRTEYRIIFIFIIFSIHFYLYEFVKLNSTPVSSLLFIKIIFLQTVVSFLILLIFDRYCMRNGISK